MLTDIEAIGREILDAAINVHRALGPGLLESAYDPAFAQELRIRGLLVREQVPVGIHYKGIDIPRAFVIDLLVNDLVIIETKAVEELHPVHTAQIITYLKLYDRRLGYLVNFNVPLMKDGFKRIVNNWHYNNAPSV